MIYNVVSEPCGDQYIHLIDFAIANSDAFMLVYPFRHNHTSNDGMEFMSIQLQTHRLLSRESNSWTVTSSTDSQIKNRIEIYAAEDSTREFLLQPGRLYAWKPPEFPMDLAFFINGKCWMASCAHEEFCWVSWDGLIDDIPFVVEPMPHPERPSFTYYENYMASK